MLLLLLTCLPAASLHTDRAAARLVPWRAIVEHAYDTVYRPLRAECTANMSAKACLIAMHDTSADGLYPWWVRTMLRDALKPATGLHGAWHSLGTIRPAPTALCTIEKVSTSHWRKFMCLLHGGSDGMGGGCSSGCGGCSPVLEHELRRSNSVRPDQLRAHGGDQSFRVLHDRKDWLTVVFLRDPVERFVSGYLDKCRPTIARGERHCEPLGLYINGTHSEFMRLLPHARMQLGSYVDTFPLTWNLHFFPQSLYCDDLGRNAHKYTFRGALNASLADQVGALGRLIDARALAATPGSAPKHVGQGAAAASFKTDNDSGGHKTDAAARLAGLVATESAARRLLEYFAIDYVELGLELPSFLVKLPLPALSRSERRLLRL